MERENTEENSIVGDGDGRQGATQEYKQFGKIEILRQH